MIASRLVFFGIESRKDNLYVVNNGLLRTIFVSLASILKTYKKIFNFTRIYFSIPRVFLSRRQYINMKISQTICKYKNLTNNMTV